MHGTVVIPLYTPKSYNEKAKGQLNKLSIT